MPIQPASSGPLQPGTRLTGKTPVEREARTPSLPAGADSASDRIELSGVSRDLAEAAGAAEIPFGEVPSERLREIGARLLSGHYQRPEIREVILRRILAGL